MGNLTREAAVAAVVDAAAARLGVAPSDLILERVEHREFRDSSLDCPQPGAMYAQVITPGYVVIIRSTSGLLEYHVSSYDGSTIFCSGV
jgi:hypothetical protein